MLAWYNSSFPLRTVSNMAIDMGKKYTMLYTNVPGFVKPVYYGGKLIKRFISPATGCGNVATAITAISINKRLTIGITSDTSQIENIQEVIDLFNKEIDELGMAYDPAEEGDD